MAVKKTARYLTNKRIVAVYSSRLTRAYQTAEIIAKKFHKKVIVNRRLLDIRSPLQGKPLAYARSFDGNFYQPRFIRVGGESLTQVCTRIDRFLRSVVRRHPGEQVVVVTHGDLMMSVYDRYSGRSWPQHGYSFNNWYVPMASGFKIEFDAKGSPIRITKLSFH